MIDDRRTPAVQVDRLDASHGAIGVQVRVDGHAQRRSTVKSTVGEPRFTGRDAELAAIAGQLAAARVVVVHGAPGLGKSRLAKEFAHQHADAYPGGMFFVPFGQPPPTELAKLLRDRARSDEPVEDQCRRALADLGGAGRALLIYDAIADERTLSDWLPGGGLDWHLIATSTSSRWAAAWRTVELAPLPPAAARELAATILDDDAAAHRLAGPIAERAGGIAIELCASAAAAHERLRRGRTVERVSADLATETTSSFESAWRLLSSDAQLVLQVASTFVTPHIPTALVAATLQRTGWDAGRVEDAIDDARDRKLASGDGDSLDVHQLVARFAGARGPLDGAVARALLDGLLDSARAFSERPGDLDRRARLQAHPLCPDDWSAQVHGGAEWHAIGDAITDLGKFAEALPWYECAVAVKQRGEGDPESLGTSLHQIGYCCVTQGRFAEALPWFERAVSAKQQGDTQARVDRESLGTSLHLVGYCCSSQGKFADALPWYERAVAAKEQGDVQGRVDAASLGASLHQLGYCFVSQGRFAEALPWFERAVAAKEQGDVHGRVDPQSLGTSLHQVGYCYVRQGQFAEALPWFERAVAEAEQGDVHGRVDPQSLGKSLHQLGYCHFRLGDLASALPWFERAVAAKEQGDVHGRIDPESLGTSLHLVGDCTSSQGKYAEALPWFERAVAEAEKGDIHGRVDPASLGRSVHQVGYCHFSQGRYAEALPWFERAVAEAEKGDVHGRANPASLGKSLHQVGYCYSSQGKYAEALPWFERAVTAKSQGDVHGRMDPESLGTSLDMVGCCHASQGKYTEALPWFERAVAAKSQGDLHGKVDRDSLARSERQTGDCCANLGRLAEAQSWFARAERAPAGP